VTHTPVAGISTSNQPNGKPNRRHIT